VFVWYFHFTCVFALGSCSNSAWICLAVAFYLDCGRQMVFCWAGSSVSTSVSLGAIPPNVNIEKCFGSVNPLSTVITVAQLPHFNAISP
jgi:hypothetical protein